MAKAKKNISKAGMRLPNSSNGNRSNFFEKIAIELTIFTGGTPAFIIALSIIIIWGATGPVFNYSETWQMIINTTTTIVTFLMVFLIQRGQNKDTLAVQLKLNEIIAALQGASNRIIDIEDFSEKDLQVLKEHYSMLSKLYEKEFDIKKSHSIEEAEKRHTKKIKSEK